VFMLWLREMLVILILLVLLFAIYRVVRGSIRASRREAVEEADKTIESTLKLAKRVHGYSDQEIERARKKIKTIIKQGEE
jgi:F0F1-type ATP synthase membrane subunit b/b'